MRIREGLLVPCACGTLLISGLMGLVLPIAAQQVQSETRKQTSLVSLSGFPEMQKKDVSELPDSPGATLAKAQAPALPQAAQSQTSTNQNQPNQSQPSQSPESQTPPGQGTTNQAAPQRPVGTAAAEAPNTSGIAASEPAGVAIAPAKQRRARTIIIKTGAIIGAAIAVGAVIALTEATGSKPPGAH
jgi:hypothetical protein